MRRDSPLDVDDADAALHADALLGVDHREPRRAEQRVLRDVLGARAPRDAGAVRAGRGGAELRADPDRRREDGCNPGDLVHPGSERRPAAGRQRERRAQRSERCVTQRLRGALDVRGVRGAGRTRSEMRAHARVPELRELAVECKRNPFASALAGAGLVTEGGHCKVLDELADEELAVSGRAQTRLYRASAATPSAIRAIPRATKTSDSDIDSTCSAPDAQRSRRSLKMPNIPKPGSPFTRTGPRLPTKKPEMSRNDPTR